MNDNLLTMLFDVLATHGPPILGGIGVALATVFVALLVRRLVSGAVQGSGLETLLERVGAGRVLYKLGYHEGYGRLISQTVYIVVLVVGGLLAVDTAGLSGVDFLLTHIIDFIPSLVAASGILLGGLLLSNLAAKLVRSSLEGHESFESTTTAVRMVQGGLIIMTIAIAAEQVGVHVELVRDVLVAAIAIGLAAFGLAMALGAVPTTKNILSRHYAEKLLKVGDTIEVTQGGETRIGLIIRFTPQAVVLKSSDGEEVIPSSILMGSMFRIIARTGKSTPASGDSHEPDTEGKT